MRRVIVEDVDQTQRVLYLSHDETGRVINMLKLQCINTLRIEK